MSDFLNFYSVIFQAFNMFLQHKLTKLILLVFLFSQPIASLNIECDFYMEIILDLGVPPTRYVCSVVSVLDLDNVNVQRISGRHMIRRDDSNVEVIEFNRINELTFFPGNIHQFFPNLIAIKFERTGLTSLSSENLRDFPNLLLFSVVHNNIVSIPANLFQNNRRLQHLTIDNSPVLESIGENLLGRLIDLNVASFRNNLCISDVARSRNAVIRLNDILHIECPFRGEETTTSTTSTTSSTTRNPSEIDYCPASCSDKIACIADEFETGFAEQKLINERLEEAQQQNAARIQELEKIIREINVRP